MTNKSGPLAGTEEAKCGCRAVKAKYRPEFYARIGKVGGEASWEAGEKRAALRLILQLQVIGERVVAFGAAEPSESVVPMLPG